MEQLNRVSDKDKKHQLKSKKEEQHVADSIRARSVEEGSRSS